MAGRETMDQAYAKAYGTGAWYQKVMDHVWYLIKSGEDGAAPFSQQSGMSQIVHHFAYDSYHVVTPAQNCGRARVPDPGEAAWFRELADALEEGVKSVDGRSPRASTDEPETLEYGLKGWNAEPCGVEIQASAASGDGQQEQYYLPFATFIEQLRAGHASSIHLLNGYTMDARDAFVHFSGNKQKLFRKATEEVGALPVVVSGGSGGHHHESSTPTNSRKGGASTSGSTSNNSGGADLAPSRDPTFRELRISVNVRRAMRPSVAGCLINALFAQRAQDLSDSGFGSLVRPGELFDIANKFKITSWFIPDMSDAPHHLDLADNVIIYFTDGHPQARDLIVSRIQSCIQQTAHLRRTSTEEVQVTGLKSPFTMEELDTGIFTGDDPLHDSYGNKRANAFQRAAHGLLTGCDRSQMTLEAFHTFVVLSFAGEMIDPCDPSKEISGAQARQLFHGVPEDMAAAFMGRELRFGGALNDGSGKMSIDEAVDFMEFQKQADVTAARLKEQYKVLALKMHPDKVRQEEREQATAEFQKLEAAKEVLEKMLGIWTPSAPADDM